MYLFTLLEELRQSHVMLFSNSKQTSRAMGTTNKQSVNIPYRFYIHASIKSRI